MTSEQRGISKVPRFFPWLAGVECRIRSLVALVGRFRDDFPLLAAVGEGRDLGKPRRLVADAPSARVPRSYGRLRASRRGVDGRDHARNKPPHDGAVAVAE